MVRSEKESVQMKRHAAAAIALALLMSASAYAQTPAPPAEPSLVVSTGEGVVKHAPDRAWVTISAESRGKTPADVQKANADAMSAVMQKIKGGGIPAEAVRTASYDLQPEFDYANGKQTLRGYVARNSVEVRVDDLAKLGSVIDVSVGAGATSVSNIRFDLKDRTAAEQEALKLAVADARTQADTAAQAAGVKVERIVRLEVHRDASMPQPRPVMMAMRSEMAAAAPPPMSPGELEVRAIVTLTAAIR
jgi:uncharacterized protein YggE